MLRACIALQNEEQSEAVQACEALKPLSDMRGLIALLTRKPEATAHGDDRATTRAPRPQHASAL